MTVLDASAVLAYLQGEPGADTVEQALDGAVVGAANWSEVLARLVGDLERSLAEAVLVSKGVSVEPVTRDDAVTASRYRAKDPHLSLGDRLCLALSDRLGEDVLTADRAWGSTDRIIQIR